MRTAAAATLTIVLLACGSQPAPSAEPASLIPLPASLVEGGGTLELAAGARIVAAPGLEQVGELLAGVLRRSTGFGWPVVAGEARSGDVALRLDASVAGGDEGYVLDVTGSGVSVRGAAAAGVFYGCQSLRQLLPAAVEASTTRSGPWVLPWVHIEDAPRFGWRGVMLDVARHFFGLDEVKRLIDSIAYHKLNRLHLHLSDDQGWRVQIDAWPQLTAIGGSTEVGGGPGGFFTKAELRDLVGYAAARFVTVVPEIDMPGHCNAALASYPELNESGVAPELYTGTEVGFSSLWIGGEITYQFIDEVVGELSEVFPGPYFHIGGDEAKETPSSDYALFLDRVQAIVQQHGKTMVGWEEIGAATLEPPVYAQWWLSDPRAEQARAQGALVIASPLPHAYLDIKYDENTPAGQSYIGYTDVEKAYVWSPTGGTFDEDAIAGVESPLWTEAVTSRADIDLLVYPRLAGHAEIGWSPEQGREWESYRVRLARHGQRLDAMGIGFYRSPLVDW